MNGNIRNCSVCVVGGAGFLGSHLVDHLVEDRGCKVLVLDDLSSGKMEFIHTKATFEEFDLRSSARMLAGILKECEIEWVFNHAGIPFVPDSVGNPIRAFEVNTLGALKVMMAAQKAGCKGILQVTSAEVYGYEDLPLDVNEHPRPIHEEDPLVPRSSYAASKVATDCLIPVRWKEAKTPVIGLRQFNCIGARETHPYVVTEIVSQLAESRDPPGQSEAHAEFLRNKTATVKLGNNSSRDFLWAGDHARIAVRLLEEGEFGECYNLGGGESIKIWDLAKLVGKVMGFSDVKVEVDPARFRPWEVWHLKSDNSKLEDAVGNLGSLLPLEEMIGHAVRWFEERGGRWPWQQG